MSYQHQRVSSIKSRRVHKHERKPFCGFCKNLGKSKLQCNHSIKGCIVLKNNECRYCHDLGHTKTRCPKLKVKEHRRNQKPRVTPLTFGCGSGWNEVSKRMKNQDTIHRLQKKQRIVKKQEIRSNKFAALEEEDERDLSVPNVVKTANELKGAWVKSLSQKKSTSSSVEEITKALKVKPALLVSWGDAAMESDEESDIDEEIVLDSYGRPEVDNSAW